MLKPTLLASSLKDLALTTVLTTSLCAISFIPTAQALSLGQPQAQTTEAPAPANAVEQVEQVEAQVAELNEDSCATDSDGCAIAPKVNKPQEVPDFTPLLDATLAQFQDENTLNMMVGMLSKDTEKQQVVISYINKLLKEPGLKEALQQEMKPLLADSDYDLKDEDEFASAVADSATTALSSIIYKGVNRLSDEQIKGFIGALVNIMRKVDAPFLTKAEKVKDDPQEGIYLLTDAIDTKDLNAIFDVLYQSLAAQLKDSPKPIDLSESEKQEAITGLITTFSKWYAEHEEEANKLMAIAMASDEEGKKTEPNLEESALFIKSFVDLVDSYNSDDQKNVLLRRALVKTISDGASDEEGFSLF